MTKLTTHCLDTFSGKPAKGVKVDIYFVSGNRTKLNTTILNNNGRSDKPLVDGNNFKEGQYELIFLVIIIRANNLLLEMPLQYFLPLLQHFVSVVIRNV